MKDLRNHNILVVGSSNTDMVVKTNHLPRPGETVLGGTFFMNPGGKGANQAVAVARLGGQVSFICKTGSDIFGHQSQQLFEEEGIDTSYIFSDPKNPSGVALITVDAHAENCIVVASGANANLLPSDLAKSEEAIEKADLILMQLEIPMDTVEFVAKMASKKNKRVILNPAPAQTLSATLLRHLYMITPNETEAEMISGVKITDDATLYQAAQALLDQGVQRVFLSLGGDGVFAAQQGETHLEPICKAEMRNATGAGDAMMASLVWSFLAGRDLAESCAAGTAAAAIAVESEETINPAMSAEAVEKRLAH